MARGKAFTRHAQQSHTEGEDAPVCPLCIEPLDAHEQTWFPCACGYQVCAFCYQRLQLENSNQCPGCRTEYGTQQESQKPEAKSRPSPGKHSKTAAKHLPNGIHSPRGKATAPIAEASASARATANGNGALNTANSHSGAASEPSKQQEAAAAGPASRAAAARASGGAAKEVQRPQPDVSDPIRAINVLEATMALAEEKPSTSSLGKAKAWADPNAPAAKGADARGAEPQMPPSPSKWPELGTAHPPAGSSRQSGSAPASRQNPSSASELHKDKCEQAAASRALWEQLLAGTRAVPDPHGSQLRQAIQEAVGAGRLSCKDGATQLLAFLEALTSRAAAGAQPPFQSGLKQEHRRAVPGALQSRQEQPLPVSAEPSGRTWLEERGGAYPLAAPSLRNGLSTGLGHPPSPAIHFPGGKEAKTSRETSGSHSSSHWLQSGVVSGLGLSIGSGGNSLGDLWGPPSRQPSIWASKRLDADAVPDSLQELWADAQPAKSSSALFSDRNSTDSLGSLAKDGSVSSSFGGQQPLANGQYGAGLGGAFPHATSSLGFSQGVASGLSSLGLGSAALQASHSYLQGVQAALGRSGTPPHFSGGLGQQLLGPSQHIYSQGLASGLGVSPSSQPLNSFGVASQADRRPLPTASQPLSNSLQGFLGQQQQQQQQRHSLSGLWSQQQQNSAQGGLGLINAQDQLQRLASQQGLLGFGQQTVMHSQNWQARGSSGFGSNQGSRLYQQ